VNEGEVAAAVRRGVGLFPMPTRGLIEVTGEDGERWLDGMLSNHVAALSEGSEHSGCYALLLTPKGRIVADFHVLLRGSGFWLETRRDAVAGVMERLERYIIADDVRLADRSGDFDRLGVEGPGAGALLARASGRDPGLARDACCELDIGGSRVVLGAFGWSGESAYQIFAARGEGERVAQALSAASGAELLRADPGVLEVLRVEAGIPALGAELDEEVLPAEAHLDHAISTTKGCYTGQEIVARLRSRGQVNHLLVGLRFCDGQGDAEGDRKGDGEELPALGEKLFAGERETGEVTSVCRSATAGPIGLGYVRREHAEPSTLLRVGDSKARVSALPFVLLGDVLLGDVDPGDVVLADAALADVAVAEGNEPTGE
jgi:folate-binding protein YgfZ